MGSTPPRRRGVAVSRGAGATDDFGAAASAWNRDHPLTGPRSGGICPLCNDQKERCYGVHADTDGITRWTCFNTDHGLLTRGCGREGEKGEWYGDALDAEAYRRGMDRAGVLRADGYLTGTAPRAPRAPLPSSPPPSSPPIVPDAPVRAALDGWTLNGTMFANKVSTEGEPLVLTWAKLVSVLSRPRGMPPGGKDALPLWYAGTFSGERPHSRASGAEEKGLAAIVLDLDADREKVAPKRGEPDLEPDRLRAAFTRALPGIAWVAHTSPSSSSAPDGAWRWRVVVPLASPVSRPTYDALLRILRLRLLESAIPFAVESDFVATTSVNRAWFMPAALDAAHFVAVSEQGDALDGAAELALLARREKLTEEALATRLDADCETKLAERLAHYRRLEKVEALGFLRPSHAWVTERPPPRRYIVHSPTGDGVLARGIVAILGAGGGTGKTFALTGLALSVVTGRPWLGALPMGAENTRRAVLILGEESREEMQRRIYAQAQVIGGVSPGDLERLLLLPGAGLSSLALTQAEGAGVSARTPFAEDLWDYLEAKAGPGWDAIILDPLSHFAGPDVETDNAAATRLLQVLARFAALPGSPAVVVAHHTSKDKRTSEERAESRGAGAIRGSSAIVDHARWAGLIETYVPADEGETKFAVLRTVKTNYAPPDEGDGLLLARAGGGALRVATEAERAASGFGKAPSKAKRTPPPDPKPVRGIAQAWQAETRAAQEKYDKAKISAASARDRALLKAGDDATKKARAQEEHRIAAEKAENIYRRECKAAEDRRELGRSHAAENATSKYD